MQDEQGLYYFPDLNDRQTRMYVRLNAKNQIEFRLMVESKPEIWDKHGWIPYEVLALAQDLYNQERNPNLQHIKLYDLKVAKSLLKSNPKTPH